MKFRKCLEFSKKMTMKNYSFFEHCKIVKECIEEALKCEPNDGSAHYILGRFYVELLKLPWAVRSMASSIGRVFKCER